MGELRKMKNFESKQAVLGSLNLAIGVHERLNYLTQSEDDLKDFMSNYWKGRNNQVTALSKFHQYKLNERNMQYGEFENLYQVDTLNALEQLFMHPVYDVDVEKLEKETAAGRISLELLYQKHICSPLRPLPYFLLMRSA